MDIGIARRCGELAQISRREIERQTTLCFPDWHNGNKFAPPDQKMRDEVMPIANTLIYNALT